MEGIELLRLVFEWLPRTFVIDVLLYHLVADDPLALRWRSTRRSNQRVRVRARGLT